MKTATAAASGETLLTEALTHVESQSIRDWATSAHNRPIFVRLAERAVEKAGPSAAPQHFAVFIMAKAIGLWD